jgi:signal transduction histidine kinase/CheY-like chemotaxis protein
MFGYTYRNFTKVSRVVESNLSTYQVLQESEGLLAALANIETSSRGFIITEDAKFLEQFESERAHFRTHYDTLKGLVSKDSEQQNRITEIDGVFNSWLESELKVITQKKYELETGESPAESLKPAVSPKPADKEGDRTDQDMRPAEDDIFNIPGENENAKDLVRSGKGRSIMGNLQAIINDINNNEQQKLKIKSENLKKTERNTYLALLFGGTAAAVLALFISAVTARSITKPIRSLSKATERIMKHNYNQPINFKADRDISALIGNFNAMQSAIQVREEELKRKNEEIKAKMAEINDANKLKSQFLANMSHELRTPLNSIIGFTARVIKKCGESLPPVQLENLKIVKEESNHLLDLINNLLDYSKMEAGKMEVHLETFDLTTVIHDVSNMTKALLEGKPLKYEVKLYANEEILIKSDPMKLKQILINLISNAIKYSERGTIRLSVDRLDQEYCLKLQDEGIGISNENISNIFDEFRQVDGSYTRKVGGTGLGLSITKKFTEMLGGRIEVNSAPDVGSCFTIYLPVNSPGTDTQENSTEAVKKTSESGMDKTGYEKAIDIGGQKKTIVCVDDDASVQRLYNQYLREQGFLVVTLSGKEDVVSKIREMKPDVVLLDIMLPNKDGWDILMELKAEIATREIPVIISSVLSEKNLAYRMKADEYLVKPVTQEELIGCVLQTMKKKAGIEDNAEENSYEKGEDLCR